MTDVFTAAPLAVSKKTKRTHIVTKQLILVFLLLVSLSMVLISLGLTELNVRLDRATVVTIDDKPVIIDGLQYASIAQAKYMQLQELLPKELRNIDEWVCGPSHCIFVVIVFGFTGGVLRLLYKFRNGQLDKAKLRVLLCDPFIAVFCAIICIALIASLRELLFESKPWVRFIAIAASSLFIGFFPSGFFELAKKTTESAFENILGRFAK